jgi:hypothetical protein
MVNGVCMLVFFTVLFLSGFGFYIKYIGHSLWWNLLGGNEMK